MYPNMVFVDFSRYYKQMLIFLIVSGFFYVYVYLLEEMSMKTYALYL